MSEAFLLADAAIRACALLTKQKEAYGYYGTMGVRLSIYNKKQSDATHAASLCFCVSVELEGFEPSSKQGTNRLSTCLFQTSLSGISKTWTTN